MIDLGYTTIAQVAETQAVLGMALYWNWGFEMAVNGAGVSGGVQAAATKCHAEAAAQVDISKPAPRG